MNGLCYLATFIFGINSVGLILYSGQLAINSFMEGSEKETEVKGKEQFGSLDSTSGSPKVSTDSSKENRNSDEAQ